ncbi:glutathione S-transferase [Shewanella sp. NIFS-20-20]|nr:glutathione S-transferase [Shewanella sp. NIFS-20-20]
MSLPLLYSFRRCPYAMRARLALLDAGIKVRVREIRLQNKPPQLLAASAKGTVPVLVLPNGQILEQSLDIMHWAYTQARSPHLTNATPQLITAMATLITENDAEFKPWLDKYKYADRYPQASQHDSRQQACQFIAKLETLLSRQAQLQSSQPSLVDYAIFPFIRQFAAVDPTWFAVAPYPKVRYWLQQHLHSPLFQQAMTPFNEYAINGAEGELPATKIQAISEAATTK